MSLRGKVQGSTIKGRASSLKEIHGYNAYELAVINGFEGTLEEWFASLNGSKIVNTEYIGKDENGGNIYQQTFDNGHTNVFIAPKGADGKDGENGKDGNTPIKGIDYFDGENGKDGADGYTPRKGIDYFDGVNGKDGADGKDYVLTSSDKTEIANIVLAELPVAEDISV